MRNVESDQRWGVGVTADPGTDFAKQNGWLGVDDDNGLWLVNSTGVVTIDGQQVLMVVLTQHDSDFATGVNLCSPWRPRWCHWSSRPHPDRVAPASRSRLPLEWSLSAR